MKKNIGNIDKIIRLFGATVIAWLYFGNIISGTFGIVLLVAAGMLLLTSMVSFCPLYTLFGFSTCSLENK